MKIVKLYMYHSHFYHTSESEWLKGFYLYDFIGKHNNAQADYMTNSLSLSMCTCIKYEYNTFYFHKITTIIRSSCVFVSIRTSLDGKYFNMLSYHSPSFHPSDNCVRILSEFVQNHFNFRMCLPTALKTTIAAHWICTSWPNN